MRILLISPSSCDFLHNESVPLGIVSIGTYLKHENHEVKIVDFNITHQPIERIIDEFKPDICGISVRSSKQVSSAIRLSKKIKKSSIPVVWGGAFTTTPKVEQFFEENYIDIVSLGEGEITWIELVDAFANNKPLEKIKGIAFKKNGKVIQTEKREFLDLSTILPCDWSLVDMEKYFQHLYGAHRMIYVYMSKGCPGHCAFCYNNDFHNSCIRRKSVEMFMTEIRTLVQEYNIDGFYLADEFAFSKKSDLYTLCDALDELPNKLIWGFETRIGAVNKEDLERARKSGCCAIHFGIETASPNMIERVGKKIPFDKVIPTFELCNELGIIPVSTFIIGMPGETVEDLKYTVDFIKKLPSNEVSVMIYTYLYHSKFGKEIYNSGKYKLPKRIKEYIKADVYYNRLPNFSEIPTRDLKVIQGYFFWHLIFKDDYVDYPNDEKGLVVLRKHIEVVLRRVPFINIVDMPEAISRSFFPFVRFFFAANFYKKIRQKYGLL